MMPSSELPKVSQVVFKTPHRYLFESFPDFSVTSKIGPEENIKNNVYNFSRALFENHNFELEDSKKYQSKKKVRQWKIQV